MSTQKHAIDNCVSNDLTTTLTKGHARDILHDINKGNYNPTPETSTTTYIPGGDTIKRYNITPSSHLKQMMYALDDNDIFSTITINNSTHLITNIQHIESGGKEESATKHIIGIVIPSLAIVTILYSAMIIISHLPSSITGMITSSIVLGLVGISAWRLLRILTHSMDDKVRISSIPVWTHYQHDLSMVEINTPWLLDRFNESTIDYLTTADKEHLETIVSIITEAEEKWRKSHQHPEDRYLR